MKKYCKKCEKVQEVTILWEKKYTKMRSVTRVVECNECKDRFLDIEKGGFQLELFKTP